MQSRSGKAVFGVNAAVSVALVFLVAAIALVVNPPSPPGIAAFAPQASKAITKAPPSQSSSSGLGAGECAAGQVCTGPSTTPRPTSSVTPKAGSAAAASAAAASGAPPAVGVPSALQCYSWPNGAVTQTFDPQSPPCIATWPGAAKGNGGSTAQGVTGTTIRVAIPMASTDSQLAEDQPILDFVNTHFELYGRKFVLAPYTSAQMASKTTEDPNAQKADTEQVSSMKAFASFDYVDINANSALHSVLPTYVSGMASDKVISLIGGEEIPTVASTDISKAAPYVYSYYPALQSLLQQTAVMTCAELAGHDATHSSKYASKQRTFALVLPDAADFGGPIPGLSSVESTLAACGITDPPIVYTDHSNSGNGIQAQMAKLKAKGITTLIYLPHLPLGGGPTDPMTAANSGRYDPEWIIAATSPLTGANIVTEPSAETSGSFGVISLNKLLPLSATPWNVAFLAAGGSPAVGNQLLSGSPLYHELLALASGVQMAGPNLTPQTFASALQATTFPNPGGGVGPSYQGSVGFSSSNVMIEDFAGWWPSPNENIASTIKEGLAQAGDDYQNFCWNNLGTRYVDSSWPATDTFRQGGCPR